MKRSARIGVVAAVAAVAATLTGTAAAALTPTFAVTGPRLGADSAFGPTVSISAPATDDALARLTIYVPLGYTLSAPASPSSTIGTVTATASVADAGNVTQTVKGSIVGTPTATDAVCDPGAHVATWNMNLTVPGGGAIAIPMYVDQAAGSETAFAAYRVVVCLPPPDVPAGTPGRAALGAKLVSARFNLDAFTGDGDGEQVWRSLWLPYGKGTGQPNPDGAVEAQSIVRVPTVVTLSAKRIKGKKATTVTLRGSVKEAGNGIGRVAVTIGSGQSAAKLKRLRVVRTATNGSFSTRASITKATWFGATAQVPQRTLAATFCRPTFGVPCVSATLGASRVVGKAIKVAR
jgi:hypothetical protein